MSRVPIGRYSGYFDAASGIPDASTGVPSTDFNYASNCFVYDKKQWVNQGCVQVSEEDQTIGKGINDRGGAFYALEWDPYNRHIRSWVFPKDRVVPENLLQAVRGGGEEIKPGEDFL